MKKVNALQFLKNNKTKNHNHFSDVCYIRRIRRDGGMK